MSHSPYVCGDGDWKEYYRTHCSLSQVNRRLIKVEELIKQGAGGGDVDLSGIQEEIDGCKSSLTSLDQALGMMRQTVKSVTETCNVIQQEVSALQQEVSDSTDAINSINGDVSANTQLIINERNRAENAEAALQAAIDDIPSGGGGTVDLTPVYRRIDGLEKGTSGQVAANKNEIADLKERLNRNNIN